MNAPALSDEKCAPCRPGTAPLGEAEAKEFLHGLTGWVLQGKAIVKTYQFANYHETMAFVNATAWVSHIQDHHPDIVLGYNRCQLTYSTHSCGGLSRNDFICAAKIDALFSL